MFTVKKFLTACSIVAILSLAIYAYGFYTVERRITAAGKIKALGVGIYWDSNCTEEVTSINWGTVEPNSTTNETVYMRNEGNVDATLYLSTENWDPPGVETFITLGWNYTDSLLAPDEVIVVDFILEIANITGITSFSFDIIITTSG